MVSPPLIIIMASVVLYYDTRYSTFDRPLTSSVLEADSSHTDTLAIVDLIDENAAHRMIRVKTTEYIASSTKFVMISEADAEEKYYTVDSYAMLNKNIAAFILTIDPILSGYDNYMNIFGPIARATPDYPESEDFNMIDEPFTPQGPIKEYVRNTSFPAIGTGGDVSLVSCTVDVDSLEDTYKTLDYTYNDSGVLQSVSEKYSAVKIAPSTQIATEKTTGSYGIYKPGTTADGFAKLNALGLNNAVLGRWNVPSTYISGTLTTTGSNGYVSKLLPAHESLTVELQTDTEAATYTPNNYKALYLYAVLHCKSNVGSDDRMFRWCDIASPSDKNQTLFYTDANLLQGGCPYLIPVYMFGTEAFSIGLGYTLSGATWAEPGMVWQGTSGLYQKQYDSLEKMSNIAINSYYKDIDFATSVVGKALNVSNSYTVDKKGNVKGNKVDDAGIANGLVGWMHDVTTSQNALTSAGLKAKFAETVYTPAYIAQENPGLALRYPNNFCITMRNLSVADMKRFDKFLTMYGWACSEYLNDDLADYLFNHGINFSYIQTAGCQVIYNNAEIANVMKSILDNGARFWKVAGKITIDNIFDSQNVRVSS